VTGRKLEDNTD